MSAGGQTYREGDKVLQNKNTLMASNGDLGRITDFYTDEEGTAKTVIEFPDGRIVTYETEDLEMIEHANAITIHKSQGSECDIVIIPWVRAFYMMLKRNILYTGITRAKKKVYLVGPMERSLPGNPYGRCRQAQYGSWRADHPLLLSIP